MSCVCEREGGEEGGKEGGTEGKEEGGREGGRGEGERDRKSECEYVLPCCLLCMVPRQWTGNGGMGPGLWKRVAPIHLHLYGQDVGSVASLQNIRGREGGRQGGEREGGERREGGEGGGKEEWNRRRERESTCKCECKYVPMSGVCVCVRGSPSLPPSPLPHSLPPSGREGRGREEWMDRGRERDCKSECEIRTMSSLVLRSSPSSVIFQFDP